MGTINRWFAAWFLTVCAVVSPSLWGQTKPAVSSNSDPVELAEIEIHLVNHDRDGIVPLLKQRGLSDSIPAGYPEALLPDLGATEVTLEAMRGARTVHPASNTSATARLLSEELEIRTRLLNEPRNAALHQVLGWIYIREDRSSDGVSESSEAVKLQPNFASAHFQLGLAFLDQGNRQQAAAELHEAARLRPDLFIFHRVLAQSALKSGDLKEAKNEFWQDASRGVPGRYDSYPHEMLADIYLKEGDFNSAIKQYKNILFMRPNDVTAKRKLDEAQQSTQSRAGGSTSKSRTAGQAYDPSLLHPSTLQLRAPNIFYVQFITTRGGFLMTVNRTWAPIGADRFYNLVKNRFYDDMALYRVVANFVAQFGISSYPAVSEAWEPAALKDDPVTKSNKRGCVSFAASGPNTRTTQLFINLKDNPNLDKTSVPFAVLGDEDMKVVETFNNKYGEISKQAQWEFARQGKIYSDKTWPQLDRIIKASIIDISP
jgi:cyclophilin family peptidyl-prolyl cis-trans isomerase